MVFFIAIILGMFVAGNINDNQSKTIQKLKKTTQISTKNILKNKPATLEIERKPKKLEPTVEEVKAVDKKPEPIVEEVKAVDKKPELIVEEVKAVDKKPEPIVEEVKAVDKKPEPTSEEVNVGPTKQDIKEVDNSDESSVNWLRLVLYMLGSILVIATGKYLYTRIKNKLSVTSKSNFIRTEFKTEVQPETTEQETTQQEEQPETTEQETTEQEDENNKK